VCIHEVVDAIAFAHAAAFVEEVLLFGNQTVDDRRGVYFEHVVFEFRSLGRELSPIEVGLSVVVDEHGRVNLRDALHRLSVPEGSVRGIRYGNAFVDPVVHAVIEVVFPIFICGIGCVQGSVAVWDLIVRTLGREGVLGYGPVFQVRGRDQIVLIGAVVIGTFVARDIQIQSSVLPLVSLRIGKEHAGGHDGILCGQHAPCAA